MHASLEIICRDEDSPGYFVDRSDYRTDPQHPPRKIPTERIEYFSLSTSLKLGYDRVFSVKLFSFIPPLSRVQESSCRGLGNSIPPPRRNRLVHGIRTNAVTFFFFFFKTPFYLVHSFFEQEFKLSRHLSKEDPSMADLYEGRKLALVGKLFGDFARFHARPLLASRRSETPEMFSMNTECAPVNSIFPAAGSNGVHRTSPRFSLPLINRCSPHSRNAENERCWGEGLHHSLSPFVPSSVSPSFSFFFLFFLRFALEIVLSKTIDDNVQCWRLLNSGETRLFARGSIESATLAGQFEKRTGNEWGTRRGDVRA